MRELDTPIFVLTGATAVGKKAIGLSLAKALPAEVVLLDSVKVYRGLDIGSARTDQTDWSGVEIHLSGIAHPSETYSVGRYLTDASKAVEEIDARHSKTLFLGGTPLYLQGLLRGMFKAPPADPAIRDRHARVAETEGVSVLHDRLKEVDALASRRIHPNDFKRISRALEIHELTGRTITELQATTTSRPIHRPMHVVGIRCERDLLWQRQEARLDRMLEHGFLDEVGRLLGDGSLGDGARQAIGYREMIQHLTGKIGLDEAKTQILRSTKEFTRNQLKWMRRFSEIDWIERTAGSSDEDLAASALSSLNSRDDSG